MLVLFCCRPESAVELVLFLLFLLFLLLVLILLSY
jgi:hypothetical protein